MTPQKEYLGDGVYVEVERGMLCLTANDGCETIWLEPKGCEEEDGMTERNWPNYATTEDFREHLKAYHR